MKFIRKHSPGPLSVEYYGFHSKIIDGDGNVIAKVISNSSDADGMACFGLMRDYLIEEAKALATIIDIEIEHNEICKADALKRKLNRVIELIKKAGVEVVE